MNYSQENYFNKVAWKMYNESSKLKRISTWTAETSCIIANNGVMNDDKGWWIISLPIVGKLNTKRSLSIVEDYFKDISGKNDLQKLRSKNACLNLTKFWTNLVSKTLKWKWNLNLLLRLNSN